MGDSAQPRPKRRRITRACDFCHRRGLKCRPSDPPSNSCLTCTEYQTECTQTRRFAKRGKKVNSNDTAEVTTVIFNDHNIPVKAVSRGKPPENWPGRIQEQKLGERFRLAVLVDVYFDTVFPIFPLFHEETFRSQWSDPSYPHYRASYATLMAMLALSACHLEKGALFTPVLRLLEQPEIEPCERFLSEAIQTIPSDFGDCTEMEYARTFGLIAICALQLGRRSLLHRYLSLFQALVAHNGLHDESRWPGSIEETERNTWRCVMWSMYRLEVHSACVMDHMIRSSASQLMIAYPTLKNADGPGDPGVDDYWLIGWNFATDLYQLLEQAWMQYNIKRSSIPTSRVVEISTFDVDAQLLKGKENIEKLPSCFQKVKLDLNCCDEVKYNFQAVSIAWKHTLVTSLFFKTDNIPIHEIIEAAQGFLKSITIFPIDYLKPMDTSVFQEISILIHLLNTVNDARFSLAEFLELRGFMVSLIEFLEKLSESIASAAQIASDIQGHITQLDSCLEEQIVTNSTRSSSETLGSFSLPPNYINQLRALLLPQEPERRPQPRGNSAVEKAYELRGDKSPPGFRVG